jgi:hypothetical protein
VPARNWGGAGWTFWQRTNCARIRGVRGCVDGDVFNGRDLATVVLPPQPANTVPPALGGAVRVGGTLAATPGIWEALPPPTLAYRWQRCDAEGAACGRIRRATAPTYVVTPADRGHRLRAAVVASSRGRSATAYSELTEVVG